MPAVGEYRVSFMPAQSDQSSWRRVVGRIKIHNALHLESNTDLYGDLLDGILAGVRRAVLKNATSYCINLVELQDSGLL